MWMARGVDRCSGVASLWRQGQVIKMAIPNSKKLFKKSQLFLEFPFIT
jgi:hypothetical protein